MEIEALLDAPEDTLPRPSAEGLGTLVDYPEGLRKYEKFLVTTGTDLSGMTVVLDTANGAASVSARDVFLDLNAEIAVIGEKPNGLNINDGVGSTHPEQLQELVKETGADLGLAFDGDSDRLIAWTKLVRLLTVIVLCLSLVNTCQKKGFLLTIPLSQR